MDAATAVPVCPGADRMNRILEKNQVAPDIARIVIRAPEVAAAYRPGQFVIVRPLPESERIPLTIADTDAANGTITLYVQAVGRTTRQLNRLDRGEVVADLVGPLGKPSELQSSGSAVLVGGGVGIALIYPLAKTLASRPVATTAIVGGRTAGHVLLADALAGHGVEVVVCTDDGSRGRAGFVTNALDDRLARSESPDRVYAAGPIPMMAAVAEATRPYGIPTTVSLNPIMVDGTGMCGGCRVEVGGVTRFACVDGPDFDGHLVDFEQLALRNQAYREFERLATNDCVAAV